MEDTKSKQAKLSPKKSSGGYIALAGFDTSEGKRFEEGDSVSGLKPADEAALLEMGAIAEEK